MKSTQKYVLITGATSGIGYQLAKLFARDNNNLIIVARNQAALDKVADELNTAHTIDVIPISKNLFDRNAPFELYEEIQARGIEVNVLVNNAGQGQYGEFSDTNIQRETDIIQLNIVSLITLTKLFLKDMISNGLGKILNLSSVASKIPGPYQSVYHGTKAFVQSFTEALRSEVKDKGITVTALLPGATDTDFFRKAEMLNAKNVVDGELADAAKVAKDGYDALMNNDDKVISGFKNKIQVGMSNIMPDDMVADNVKKQQAPKEETK